MGAGPELVLTHAATPIAMHYTAKSVISTIVYSFKVGHSYCSITSHASCKRLTTKLLRRYSVTWWRSSGNGQGGVVVGLMVGPQIVELFKGPPGPVPYKRDQKPYKAEI